MTPPGKATAWLTNGQPSNFVNDPAEAAARRDAILRQHSRNRQGRRAALRALRKAGLA